MQIHFQPVRRQAALTRIREKQASTRGFPDSETCAQAYH
jgi:hypothetical protein